MTRQQGLLLLPVAIALAVMGALAYGMTRQGAMGASSADGEYDTQATRYLAEGAVRLAKWQNEKVGCDSKLRFTNIQLPGVAGSASVDAITVKDQEFTATVTARSARGAASSLTGDKMMFFDRARQYTLALPDSALKDTYISIGSPVLSLERRSYLAATDGQEHILLNVPSLGIPKNARVTKATLSLYLESTNSVQSVTELAVHAATRAWSDSSATWIFPWALSPGGSYAAKPEATTPVALAGRWYKWEFGALVRRWESGTQSNFGLLLKPSGLNDARFSSLDGAANKPRLDVEYHKRCD